jgi:hypothetical protein
MKPTRAYIRVLTAPLKAVLTPLQSSLSPCKTIYGYNYNTSKVTASDNMNIRWCFINNNNKAPTANTASSVFAILHSSCCCSVLPPITSVSSCMEVFFPSTL